MELNRKTLLAALFQIKAYKDIVVFMDSPVSGQIDIVYALKTGYPNAVSKMTIPVGGPETDLFDDSPAEKLGRVVPVYLSRIREALKSAKVCQFEDGCFNNIRVEIDSADPNYALFKITMEIYEKYSLGVKEELASVSFSKADWDYAVSEGSKFVSDDPSRMYMNGICFDFAQGGENCLHIVGTDGRKLILFKHYGKHSGNAGEDNQVIVHPSYLFAPASNYNSVKLKLSKHFGQLLISTEDYCYEGLFTCIDGKFPDYARGIPEITEKTESFTLCAASFKSTIDSVKSQMDKSSSIYLNAENPEKLSITVADGSTTLDVEGTASRPMLLSFKWEQLLPCLCEGAALTKFHLDGSSKGIVSHQGKAHRGLSMDVTKLFMPTTPNDEDKDESLDAFRIPLKKDDETLNEDT